MTINDILNTIDPSGSYEQQEYELDKMIGDECIHDAKTLNRMMYAYKRLFYASIDSNNTLTKEDICIICKVWLYRKYEEKMFEARKSISFDTYDFESTIFKNNIGTEYIIMKDILYKYL